MAFTIKAVPPAYSSIQDDLIYTVAFPEHTSDSVTYPNYKFIGDVYIGAVLVARIKKVQDPVTSIGIFNIGQIVRNYVSAIFDPTAGVLVAQEMGGGQFNITVTMKFGEEYGFDAFLNQVVDSPRVFFNNYNGRLVGVSSSLQTRLNTIAGNGPMVRQTFLTSAYNFLNYFATTTDVLFYTVTPTGGGIAFTNTFTPSAAFNMMVLNFSPVALNAVHPGAITSATTSYRVTIGANVHTYKVICEAMYQPYMIHFLNQYGGFDSKIFSKVSRRSFDITKTDFGKLPYTVDSAGAVNYYSLNGVYNESASVYSSQYIEKLTLNSDLLTDAEYVWLADLLLSPMIYIEDGGYFFPIQITDTSYEPKKAVNDDLTNLTINIEYGKQLNAQYR